MHTHISNLGFSIVLSITLFFPTCASNCNSQSKVATNTGLLSSKTYSQYRHKSDAEIAAMSPVDRVEEYANEQVNHKYDLSDKQSELIAKYIRQDGLSALPRIVEIIDAYDPRTD